VVQFIDRAIEPRQELADAIRAGRQLSRAELDEADAQLTADRNELERLRLRVTQLAGLVRPH
jgi:hypothetical protein